MLKKIIFYTDIFQYCLRYCRVKLINLAKEIKDVITINQTKIMSAHNID